MTKSTQCVLAALAASLLGSFIVGIVTVTEWLEPTTPFLLLLGAALLPAILAGLLAASPPDQQPWTRRLVLTGIIPGLVIGLLAVALGFIWTQPQLRANIASKIPASFQDSKPLLQALTDTSPEVATAACKVMAVGNFKHESALVFNHFTQTPRLAVNCLDNSTPENSEILLDAAQSWHTQLLQGTHPAQTACELTQALADITPDTNIQTARLLQCALHAQNPNAKQCCTQTINSLYPTAAELADKLQDTHQTLATLEAGPKLIDATFAGQPQLASLSLKTPALQKITLLTACSSLSPNPAKILPPLYQLTQTLNCLGPDQTPPSNLNTWTQTCNAITNHFTIQPNAAPQNVFCNALNKEIEYQAAIALEQQKILSATPESEEGFASQIELGAELSRPEDLQKYMRELGVVGDIEYSDGQIAAVKDHLEQVESMPDGPDEDQEISAEELEEVRQQFPEVIRQLEAGGLGKEQLDAIKTLEKSFMEAPANLLPQKK